MVKSYLRFGLTNTLGVICSTDSPTTFDSSGKCAIAPALESVAVWNIQAGLLKHEFRLPPPSMSTPSEYRSPQLVTFIERSPNGRHISVGYNDGCIRIWETETQQCVVTFNGHRSAVTSLRYNRDGSILASGSKDTNIVVWDILNECGLYRLYGHKSQITNLKFLEKTNSLISSSKDTFVKFWDLETQHCFQTLVEHHTEVWSFDVNSEETRLITGSGDYEIRIWKLNKNRKPNQQKDDMEVDGDVNGDVKKKEEEEDLNGQFATFIGSLSRENKQRVVQLRLNSRGNLLFCLAAAKVIEIFRVRTDDEIAKKIKRKLKRQREKAKKEGKSAEEISQQIPTSLPTTPEDIFDRLVPLRTKHKIRSFAFSPKVSKSEDLKKEQIILSLHDNTIAAFNIDYNSKEKPYTRTHKLDLLGHRSGVRSVCFNKDCTRIMSTSNDQIKIWNPETKACIRTQSSGCGLCGVFFGARHAIIGTKEGAIEIYDLGAATLVQDIKAHDGSIWCLDVSPDNTSMATGGADNCVKFWDFELVDSGKGSKQLTLVHTRTLKLTDDVLCIKYSPNGRHIAVGLLDSKIKVFHVDTLKFFLSLYGHSLPVLCLDISSDSTLLVSGSADKDVKIWGMDFGDCHKSMFAHDNSVMQVRFVPETHYFFSAGKDKLIKYWDADKFENIMTLEGHFSEVWGLTISSNGLKLVSAANDKSIRIWQQTEEQLFLEEEREMELERLFEKDEVRTDIQGPGAIIGSGLQAAPESGIVTKANSVTLKIGEKLMEALDLVKDEEERWRLYREANTQPGEEAEPNWLSALRSPEETKEAPVRPPPTNPLLLGEKPKDYILKQLKRIKPSQLEEALMVLPYGYARLLLHYLSNFLSQGETVELVMRCVLFLFKIHQNQILTSSSSSPSSSSTMISLIRHLSRKSKETLQQYKDMIGFNIAAMKLTQNNMDLSSNKIFFDDRERVVDAIEEREIKRRKLKK